MSLKIYGHVVSQPTRAVIWACQLKGLPYELVEVDFLGGGTQTPEFKALNPSGTVPTIDDGGFILYESNAILTYLAEKHGWTDLYPGDLQQRALVNRYLHWHHGNSRLATSRVFRPIVVAALQGTQVDATAGKQAVQGVLGHLNSTLATSAYLAGDTLTLADLAAYTEFDQLEALQLIDFAPFPSVIAWLQRLKQLPHHDQANAGLHRFVETISPKINAA